MFSSLKELTDSAYSCAVFINFPYMPSKQRLCRREVFGSDEFDELMVLIHAARHIFFFSDAKHRALQLFQDVYKLVINDPVPGHLGKVDVKLAVALITDRLFGKKRLLFAVDGPVCVGKAVKDSSSEMFSVTLIRHVFSRIYLYSCISLISEKDISLTQYPLRGKIVTRPSYERRISASRIGVLLISNLSARYVSVKSVPGFKRSHKISCFSER